MILIVNLNPAVDRYLAFQRVIPGAVHRARSVRLQAGGKGINVARMLAGLLSPAEVCLPAGGLTGRLLLRLLAEEGIAVHSITTRRETRCCSIGYDEATGEETVWNEPGAALTPQVWDRFRKLVGRRLKSARLVVLSGSAPLDLAPEIFAELTRSAHQAGCRVLADLPPAGLEPTLAEKPFLVKPNHLEAAALLEVELSKTEDVAGAAVELCRRGAQSALITRGAQGAVLADADGVWRISCPELPAGHRIYATGAGDAAMAGCASGLDRGMATFEAVGFGVACATAYAHRGRGVTQRDIEQTWSKIACTRLE